MTFDALLDQVLSLWPRDIEGQAHDYQDEMHSSSLASFYDAEIEPIALRSNSMLLIQLDWIVFAIRDEISRRTTTVRPHEIRRSLVKERFHRLILDVAIPQLQGQKEWDKSFDRAELESYLASEHIS